MPVVRKVPKRQDRVVEKERIHSHMPVEWLEKIDRAAGLEGVSRSNFIAGAAFAKALAVINKFRRRRA